MIEIKNLNKAYGSSVVYKDFSLEIEQGKITCILGESGSGKTTLLNAIAGLTDFSGEINCPKCSYVFQKPNLFPNMTAIENLLLVNNDRGLAEKALKDFSLGEKMSSYPKHLSGGEAQRVSICRGLVYKKEVFLLDEPFSNLDIALKHLTVEKLKEYQKNSGSTLIVVTHDVKEAVMLADRILVLADKKIVYDVKDVNDNTETELYNFLLNTEWKNKN